MTHFLSLLMMFHGLALAAPIQTRTSTFVLAPLAPEQKTKTSVKKKAKRLKIRLSPAESAPEDLVTNYSNLIASLSIASPATETPLKKAELLDTTEAQLPKTDQAVKIQLRLDGDRKNLILSTRAKIDATSFARLAGCLSPQSKPESRRSGMFTPNAYVPCETKSCLLTAGGAGRTVAAAAF